jgi:hypothetical protein
MSRHPRFKLAAIRATLRARLGFDPYVDDGPSGEDAVTSRALGELSNLMPSRLSREGLERFEVPLSRFGLMWSRMIALGVPKLPDQSRLLALDYADLVARPAETLSRFLSFLGLERDGAREKHMFAGIAAGPASREQITAEQWEKLTEACSLGMDRLYGKGRWS